MGGVHNYIYICVCLCSYYRYCVNQGYIIPSDSHVEKTIEDPEVNMMGYSSWTRTLVQKKTAASGFNGPKRTEMCDYDMSKGSLTTECILYDCKVRKSVRFPDIGNEVVMNSPCKAGDYIMTYWGTFRDSAWVDEHCTGENADTRYNIIYIYI